MKNVPVGSMFELIGTYSPNGEIQMEFAKSESEARFPAK